MEVTKVLNDKTRSVRILNEEDRFYIVIENPTAEDKKDAMEFVTKKVGAMVQEEVPAGVIPQKVMPYEVNKPLQEVNVEKKGIAEIKIPYISTPELFVEWYLKYETLNEKNQKMLITRCRSFMGKYLTNINRSDIEKIKKFLLDFESIFEITIREVLKKNGYSSLKVFLNTEGDANIQAVYDVCKKAICEALNIK